MNIRSILKALSDPRPDGRRSDASDGRRWRDDPLSHPDLDAMSMRELGDIPFAQTRVDCCAT